MSYKIEPVSVKEFVTDSKMKLPRFQRKATWKPKQNFELAISIYQDYPVGVVIVNQEKDSRWLLDGRQRRSALKEMRANPIAVYNWAKTYLVFKATEDPSDIRTIYWNKVADYLQKDQASTPIEEDLDNDDYSIEDASEIENSFDSDKQKKGLTTLLDLILMIHQIRAGVSTWEKIFDFREYCVTLEYAPKREGNKINPEKLREFIRKLGEDMHIETQDEFLDYFSEVLIDAQRLNFESHVASHWNEILASIEIIKATEEVFRNAKIGIIELTRVSPLDAQNIFSRINSGGTQLKAEELLSAKPFWNEPVISSDYKLKAYVHDLYQKLGVEIPENIVRWDLGATLLRRIKDDGLLFEPYSDDEEINMDQVTLGFKFLSAYFKEGMSAKVVNSLEGDKSINWESDIDDLLYKANRVCEILSNCNFFRYFKCWKKSIHKLMGSAIVLEFITVAIKDWENRNMPTVDGAELKAFKRDVKILFDRLVFEYASGAWKGSGDSKMAKHIANLLERIKPIDKYAWINLINGACNGDYNGQQIALKNITPILYYSYVLDEFYPTSDLDVTYDIDHIIPQSVIEGNPAVNASFKDSLLNLSLLPKKDNISKNDKPLNEITDQWLKNQIEVFEHIKIEDFEKYSTLANVEDFKFVRKSMLDRIFGEKRDVEMAK